MNESSSPFIKLVNKWISKHKLNFDNWYVRIQLPKSRTRGSFFFFFCIFLIILWYLLHYWAAMVSKDWVKCIYVAGKASMGEKEWYFFNLRDRKYPTGLRTNRATEAGYWKTTGKDKEIFRAGVLVGMKKTLVFYKGRAPKGEKSNWVMHEYRLENKHPFRSSKVRNNYS